VPEAEGFVARLALEPDVRVLDIACGTGNVTLPLARRGATVTGLDMTPHLLEEARARAASEGLNIRFDEGFAEALPRHGSLDVRDHDFPGPRNRRFGNGTCFEAGRTACFGQLEPIWF
jgi:SAM-dependent methyltransferase